MIYTNVATLQAWLNQLRENLKEQPPSSFGTRDSGNLVTLSCDINWNYTPVLTGFNISLLSSSTYLVGSSHAYDLESNQRIYMGIFWSSETHMLSKNRARVYPIPFLWQLNLLLLCTLTSAGPSGGTFLFGVIGKLLRIEGPTIQEVQNKIILEVCDQHIQHKGGPAPTVNTTDGFQCEYWYYPTADIPNFSKDDIVR